MWEGGGGGGQGIQNATVVFTRVNQSGLNVAKNRLKAIVDDMNFILFQQFF